MNDMALTARQKRFGDEYAVTLNGTKAAIAAGYSEKTAASMAYENLRKPEILEYIHARMRACAASQEEVLAFQTNVMRGEVKDAFGLDAPLSERLKASEILSKRYAAIEKVAGGDVDPEERRFDIPARLLGREFVDVHRDVLAGGHRRYLLKGGRGSTKSSYISLEIINLLENNPELHAVVLRKVGNTLRNSVYNQMLWAIEALGLVDRYTARQNPPEITRNGTGQTIRFFGLDDPLKLKSIKPKSGYNGILWFEEKDQFAGPEELRSVEQSVIRGGDKAYIFESFNPPKTRNNWANEDAEAPRDDRLVHHSDYRAVPIAWLGKSFVEEADHQRTVNPTAYEHEYLGVPNGNGGMVFEYLELREITDEEIARFDRIYQGVDWGWYPDKFAFLRTAYDPAQERIYLLDEHYVNKESNQQTAEWILARGYGDYAIACDSAEPKSVNDYRDMGLPARGAAKGPGSIEYGFKWLQVRTIVIDRRRTPGAWEEITKYEYERDKDGNVISGYPDKDDHAISALRYAYEPLFSRRGTRA